MVNVNAPLSQELLHVTVGESETQIPAHRQSDHLWWEPEANERRGCDGPGKTTSGSHTPSLTTAAPIHGRNRAVVIALLVVRCVAATPLEPAQHRGPLRGADSADGDEWGDPLRKLGLQSSELGRGARTLLRLTAGKIALCEHSNSWRRSWMARAKVGRYASSDSSGATRGTWPYDGPAPGFRRGANASVDEEGTALVSTDRPHLRLADPADARRVAALHADSWRRHYRGAYSDEFLDRDVAADRLALWTDRFQQPTVDTVTILAEDQGALVGFAHTIFDHDREWGALLENLHVASARKRRGIGSRLLSETAARVREQAQPCGLYLWVLEQNVAAQAFYEAHGGRRVERTQAPAPGGVSTRLKGSPTRLRYAWVDLGVLVA